MGKRVLITGASESGKTHYAMGLAEKSELLSIVYSPILSDPWPGCERHVNIAGFIGRIEALCALSGAAGKQVAAELWIDEADELFSVSLRENHWILKKGRHYFPAIYIITQRPKMVAPTVRGQCNELVAFTLKDEDASELGRDFVCDLKELPSLRQGEYLRAYWKDRKRMLDKVDGFL